MPCEDGCRRKELADRELRPSAWGEELAPDRMKSTESTRRVPLGLTVLGFSVVRVKDGPVP